MLIAIEGIDGSGKTTQAKMLVEYLRQKGYHAVFLFEPTDGQYGLQLRQQAKSGRVSPRDEFLLFLKDRQEDSERNIQPALENGSIVVIDRYYYSSMAYQGARGLDPEMIREENEKIVPRPDLVLYLNLPLEKSTERIIKKRNSLPDHFESEEYRQKVMAIYNDMCNRLDEVHCIDASDSLEEVHQRIVQHVDQHIERGR